MLIDVLQGVLIGLFEYNRCIRVTGVLEVENKLPFTSGTSKHTRFSEGGPRFLWDIKILFTAVKSKDESGLIRAKVSTRWLQNG